MDKVKIALALLKKHHFWVMTGMVILLSLIGWFVAMSKLWAEYETGRDKIVKKFTDLTKINSEEKENQKWIDGLEKETRQLKAKVRIAWDKVYIEQKDHVLIWPAVLGAKNVATLEKLGPADAISINIRRIYLNYIRNEFPNLLKIVDARDLHKDGPGATSKKGAAEDEESPHDYKVIWNAANQKEIYAKLDMSEVPTDRQVRNTQEDLWVYQALLTIISQLNDRATGNYNAKVKEIQSLLIGSEAATEFQAGMSEGHVEKLESPIAPAAGAPPAAAAAASSAVGRYVDEKGVPLPDAGGPAPSPDAPPAAAGGPAPAEFKRMPVVMRLIMDQREISRLLVECANSPLPVEVRQFRLHKKGGGKPGQAPSSAPANAAGGEKDQSSYDMAVEVAGIIYIFNPPDRAKLSDVASGAQPGAEGADAGSGNPNGAAVPRADDAGGAPANNGNAPEAVPAGAAGPGDAENAEGKPGESPEPN